MLDRVDVSFVYTPLGPRKGLPRPPRRSRGAPIHSFASLAAGTGSPVAVRVILQTLASSSLKTGIPLAANLVEASPFAHHPASLVAPHAAEVALITVASLFTVALSIGGMVYYGVRSAWENIEPWVLSGSSLSTPQPTSFYGIDVTGSRFFVRESVQRAVEFAAQAHKTQMRKTKEPYVTHCIETAKIVEALLSPTEDDERAEAAVITALLHDVMDDAGIKQQRIEDEFGPQVASMVSRVSQLSATNQLVRRRLRLEDAQPTPHEATQLRCMILTMVSEPLVIVVKLADRLHNMRTVYALAPEKQRAVAEETRRVWCSLAERLGMFALKSELEDLCFAVLQPSAYRALRDELDELWGVQSIPAAAMTPEECCLSGECECSTDEGDDLIERGDDNDTVLMLHANDQGETHKRTDEPNIRNYLPSRSGGASGWLGSADASLPEIPHIEDAATNLLVDPEAAFLSEEQLETRDLVRSVLPFDASTFNMGRLNITHSARRGLEVLQGCARALLYEITVEGVASGLDVSVQGRVKSLYSSFKKMARKGVPLSQVYDARALRVVVDDEEGEKEREALAACYRLLPAVHRLWRKVAGEDDDYIAMPKESGYQSLHTAVMGPGGVPMEVQIRTASMHEVAEYGKAAHWAYKERPAVGGMAPGSASPSPETIARGHPVLRISPGGQLQDGVVMSSQSRGMRLLVAVSLASRRFLSSLATEASPEEYSALLQYVESKGYFTAGHGDMQATLEMFTLCSDGKYHRLDRFGHKLPTTMVPLRLRAPSPSQSNENDNSDDAERVSIHGAIPTAAQSAPEHGSGDSGADAEMAFMNNRIRLLRSMIEWGADIEGEGGPAGEGVATARPVPPGALLTPPAMHDSSSSVVEQLGEVLVLIWPSGKILRVPRGTTAGAVVYQELDSARARTSKGFKRGDVRRRVNVNNRLVPASTALEDGDYVVLTKEVVQV